MLVVFHRGSVLYFYSFVSCYLGAPLLSKKISIATNLALPAYGDPVSAFLPKEQSTLILVETDLG